ncbi:RNA-directed DNA polymerase, eukaryota, nucleotide-binding alpha-beta plait domain protein, partial [Tanacetum coccineum]
MGAHKQTSLQSKEDKISKISRSVFVTNFLDGCTARDLWNVCNDYGTVVDVFIPFKKSKIGKRFAFVRFIKVSNFDRLIVNLCTIWIGRHHLHANAARFERSGPEYPPGFTPADDKGDGTESGNGVNDQTHTLSPKFKERNLKEKVSSEISMKGGSILEVMDELV